MPHPFRNTVTPTCSATYEQDAMGASSSSSQAKTAKHPEVEASVPIRVSEKDCFVESTNSSIESSGEWDDLPPLPDITTVRHRLLNLYVPNNV